MRARARACLAHRRDGRLVDERQRLDGELDLERVLVGAVVERDWRRIQPAAIAYVVLGALQLIALARYPHTLDWSRPVAWVFVAMVAAILTSTPRIALAHCGRRIPITRLWATGSCLGDVARILFGYGDVLNPVGWWNSAAGLVNIGRSQGLGAA